MKRMLSFLIVLLLLPFGTVLSEENYSDGIYRGFYYDGGIEQLSIQFEIQNGLFNSIVFRSVRYKDGNYMSPDASDAQKAAYNQYVQLADHLVGKSIAAINDLYSPYDFVEDADAVTSATIQSSKLISALWDGLNRHPYKLLNTSLLPTASDFSDGIYRGSYMEENGRQVSLELVIKDGCYASVTLLSLQYDGVDYLNAEPGTPLSGIAMQFGQLTDYLTGKPISAVNDLYQPGNIAADIDGFSGATLRSPKVISAVWDALNRGGWQIH